MIFSWFCYNAYQYQFRKRASILTVCAQFHSLSEKPVFIGQLHAIMIKITEVINV